MPDTNGWNEWGKHVLAELERQNGLIEALRRSTARIETEIALLKLKAGFWGALAGAVPAVMAIAIVIWRAK